MKIIPLNDKIIREYYLGSRLSAVQTIARAARADALRQVIEEAKRTSVIIETSPNDYEVDVSRAYKFFKDLQSTLKEMGKETK